MVDFARARRIDTWKSDANDSRFHNDSSDLLRITLDSLVDSSLDQIVDFASASKIDSREFRDQRFKICRQQILRPVYCCWRVRGHGTGPDGRFRARSKNRLERISRPSIRYSATAARAFSTMLMGVLQARWETRDSIWRALQKSIRENFEDKHSIFSNSSSNIQQVALEGASDSS